MPPDDNQTPQGPFLGSRCVAGPGGSWGAATLRRVNEDGTFTIEFDVKEMRLMPYWYGVTEEEISFDDARLWSPVFAQLCPDGGSLDRANFARALAVLGHHLDAEREQCLWEHGCRAALDLPPLDRADGVLDEAASYRCFLALGLSAKQCVELLHPIRPQPLFKLYWNQTRMGGRDPAMIARPVTLDDAVAAMGLSSAKRDNAAAAFLQRFEQEHGVRLPRSLVELLRRAGVEQAVSDCHPNNPGLVPLQSGEWKLRRGMRAQNLSGDFAIVIMTPHQGDHEWAVVFDDQEADARVYVRWDAEGGDAWLLSALNIGMFFWDLAQTGLAWYQDTEFQGGKRVKRTDIGLIPA